MSEKLNKNHIYACDLGTEMHYISEFVTKCCYKAVPWLRRLVAGLSPRGPCSIPGSVHVGFLVEKVALGQVFPPSTSVFPCQFHSTDAPLRGKTEKPNHLRHKGCTLSLKAAVRP
jgi:hypothetical protein